MYIQAKFGGQNSSVSKLFSPGLSTNERVLDESEWLSRKKGVGTKGGVSPSDISAHALHGPTASLKPA